MADLFAPKLGTGIGFEQPVSMPQVGSALAGLGSTFLGRAPTAGPKPTSEEKFGAAWKQYTKRLVDQGAISEDQVFTPGTASMSQLRQFGAIYTEFSDDVFSRASTEKNVELQQIDAEQSGQNTLITEYYSSGEGAVVDAQAAQLRAQGKPKEADELEAKGLGEFVQRKAEVSKIADLAKKTQDLTTLSNDTWSINKKAVRSQVDIAASGLSELLVAFKADPTGTFDLEASGLGSVLTAFPNITITKVNKDNFGEFALQLKSEIMRTQRLRMQGEVGFELREQPSGYEADVFKGFDAIVTWAEKDLDPAEIVKRAKNEGFIRMQESGIPVGDLAAIELISSDPSIQASIIGGFTEDIQKYIGSIKDGSPARIEAMKNISTDSMKDARNHFSRMLGVYSGNSTDAKPYPEVTLDARQMGIRDNMLGLIDSHSQIDERTGKPQRFNKAAWDEYFGKNAAAIVQIAAQDSDFATTVGTSLTNDIMIDVKKIQEITKDKGITISFNNKGQMEFGVDKKALIDQGFILSDAEAAELEKRAASGDTLARQRLLDFATESNIDEDVYIAQVVGPEGARKTSVNLDDVNYKWNVLSQLGQVGSSVKDTINQELGAEAVTSVVATSGYNLPPAVAQDTAFLSEVGRVSESIGMPEEWLLRAIEFETAGSWSPSVKAPTSSATGLIQFLEGTAKGLGTTTTELAGMSRADQMRFVEKYLAPYKGRIKNFGDLYMAIHYPAGVGKADSFVLYKEGSDEYKANKSLDVNKDGTVTRGEAVARATNSTGRGVMTTPSTAISQAGLTGTPESLLPPSSSVGGDTTTARPVSRPQSEAETAAPVTQQEILPDGETSQRLGEKGGIPRVADTPFFDRDLMRFLQSLNVDPETTFSVKDLDELEAAQAEGRLKKGDQVLVGEGATAFVVEIE